MCFCEVRTGGTRSLIVLWCFWIFFASSPLFLSDDKKAPLCEAAKYLLTRCWTLARSAQLQSEQSERSRHTFGKHWAGYELTQCRHHPPRCTAKMGGVTHQSSNCFFIFHLFALLFGKLHKGTPHYTRRGDTKPSSWPPWGALHLGTSHDTMGNSLRRSPDVWGKL